MATSHCTRNPSQSMMFSGHITSHGTGGPSQHSKTRTKGKVQPGRKETKNLERNSKRKHGSWKVISQMLQHLTKTCKRRNYYSHFLYERTEVQKGLTQLSWSLKSEIKPTDNFSVTYPLCHQVGQEYNSFGPSQVHVQTTG